MNREVVLRIEDLWYKYPFSDEWVLKGINLEVRKGEFIVLTGRSGCGKSTLALTICGYIPHVIDKGVMKGRVLVKGIDTRSKPLHHLTQLVGVVLQNPEDQLFALTVEEDVAFGPENLAMPKEEIVRRVERAMRDAGVYEIRDRPIFALSGGQKQRTAIAGILAMEPEIIIFDEPTSDLDPQGAMAVLSVISEIQRRRDVTVILIEHRLDEVSKYADRVILMEGGEIVVDDEPHRAYTRLNEFLEKGVRPPQISEAAYKYGWREGMPISLEEGIQLFRPLVNGPVNLGGRRHDRDVGGRIAIEVEDLWHTYPNGVTALRGVSLRIREGEFVAIIGRNGSGKSTLSQILVGLLKPTRGTARIYGLDIRETPMTEIIKYVGYVFQNPDHQLFTNTLEDELAFGPRNLGLDEEEVRRRVEDALQVLGLERFRDRHPQSLSRGQRRRLAVATILTMQPKILILDEPTTGQDWGHSVKLMELARRLNRERGITVIFITHDMRVVAEYAERVILMHNGQIIFDGEPAELFRSEWLAQYDILPPYITQLGMNIFPDRPAILSVEDFLDVIKPVKTG